MGVKHRFIFQIFKRLELNFAIKFLKANILNFKVFYKREIINFFNNIFSQLNSVNNTYDELKKLYIIRLYLIKSTRGLSHALGKPVNGQRT